MYLHHDCSISRLRNEERVPVIAYYVFEKFIEWYFHNTVLEMECDGCTEVGLRYKMSGNGNGTVKSEISRSFCLPKIGRIMGLVTRSVAR